MKETIVERIFGLTEKEIVKNEVESFKELWKEAIKELEERNQEDYEKELKKFDKYYNIELTHKFSSEEERLEITSFLLKYNYKRNNVKPKELTKDDKDYFIPNTLIGFNLPDREEYLWEELPSADAERIFDEIKSECLKLLKL